MKLSTYDRFFPYQDTIPAAGFGNLIALPLQKVPRANGNTAFLDEDLDPYADQWAYLASVRRVTPDELETLAESVRPAVAEKHETDETDTATLRCDAAGGISSRSYSAASRLACFLLYSTVFS